MPDDPASPAPRRGDKRARSDSVDSSGFNGNSVQLRRSTRRITRRRRLIEDLSFIAANLCLYLSDTPKTLHEALAGPEAKFWQQAVDDELSSLNKYGTWTDTTDDDKPTRTLDTTWVFRRKIDKDGRVVKYKARLVIRGYMQVEGVDYGETYAPVARMTGIRLVLSIAAARGYQIFQYDVDTAFLNADVDSLIYIKRPKGCVDGSPILRLLKSLYGLRQSPRCWNSLLDETLRSFGFKPTASDACINVFGKGEAYIVVYVDDLILCAKTKPFVSKIEAFLEAKFSIKKLSELNYCLGVAITHDHQAGTISLSQTTFIDQLIERFYVHGHGLLEPMKDRITPGKVDQSLAATYRSIVGSLLYVQQWTRPKIEPCSLLGM
ncbi:hypothetical protein AeRB84_002409 [Aphanomyces euteiches]|nr:hypothetical protein AeRB84_002409 [Aphanomyces euteiches]